MIGASSTALLARTGRVAGVSGFLGDLVEGTRTGRGVTFAFVAGLAAGGVALALVAPETVPVAPHAPFGWLAFAGLLVGFGTRMGGGCTSGHGVCGASRLSRRSLAATVTFLAVGIASAVAVHFARGRS